MDNWQIVVVTGMSGAGKTTALKAFEDFGFEVFDNIPISLIRYLILQEQEKIKNSTQLSLLRVLASHGEKFDDKDDGSVRPLAIGIDIRTRDFGINPICELMQILNDNSGINASLLFIDCEDSVLMRRFTETRRKHPLAKDRRLEDGIAREKNILAPIRKMADFFIDTTEMSPHEIKAKINCQFIRDNKGKLTVFITSFSYKNGLPRSADLVFDARFLKNPHYVEELRPLTGLDKKVGNYIASDSIYDTFFKSLTTLLEPLLPRFVEEGKSYLTIATGCTGGKHRSVFLAEQLALWLVEKGIYADIKHRELENNFYALDKK